MTPSHPSPRFWFPLCLLAIGSCGVAAAWVLLVFARDQPAGWMAVIAGLDAALLLRLGGMPRGWPRAACAVLGTAVAIVLANWGIAGAQMGKAIGLLPWEAMLRLGADHAWTLVTLANPVPQLAWIFAGLLAALAASR